MSPHQGRGAGAKPLPWFRLYAEMMDDEKVRLLAFEDRWHFVALLCCKCAGLLDAGDHPDLLRRKLGVKLGLAPRELEAAAARLAEVGLIDPETFQPIAWDTRQMRSDTSRERVAAFRERQRAKVKQGCNVTETAQDTDTDTEAKADKAKAPRKRSAAVDAASTFTPPPWVPLDAWQAWLITRTKKRAPNTEHALDLAVRKLAELQEAGDSPAEVLDQSVLRGWTGLFPTNRGHDHGAGGRNRRESEAERVERINREHDQREHAAGLF